LAILRPCRGPRQGSQRVDGSGRRCAARLGAAIGVGLVVGLILAPAAGAKVFVDGKRVTVELVGGISAVPCDVEGGCSYGVVDLRLDHRSVGTHLIDCLAPKALHVVSANEHYARVFACRTVYQWRLHRLV
jgi:hypothetical protein